MKKIKYIANNKDFGIEYDWKFIKKEYEKLGCPPDVYDPTTAPLGSAKWFVETSERNIGKTTNWLLVGMIMNEHYDTIIQYVRQSEDMIMPKNLIDLFSTILAYDYVEKVTNGKWNSVTYKARRYYYCNVDENGNIIDMSPTHFMFCCCVEKAQDLKSAYNCPTGDLIIYDEFISKYYTPNEFVHFCDLCKTIMRGRRSPILVLLANTINPHSSYYNELEIYDDIQKMKIGENRLITTDIGTKIYVEIIGATGEKKRKNKILNALFFGFKNPLLGAITGENWSIKNYQHIPEDTTKDSVTYLSRELYIYHNGKYVRLDIVEHSELGLCCYAHWATKTHSDSIIFTIADRYDNRFKYRLGNGKVEKLINMLKSENRIYYATNDVGSFVDNYFNTIQMMK